jgi:hypothetical protein
MAWMAASAEVANTISATRKRPDFAAASIAFAAGLAIAFTVVFLVVMPLVRTMAGEHDFVVYWATGQLLAHHANPWDAQLIGHVEHAAGLTVQGSFFMRNPPWALPLALPLGFLSVRAAAVPWSLLMLGLLIASVRTLFQILGRPASPLHLLGYAFPPALFCVMMGQTSLFLLLGLVLFLRLYRTRPFLAGAALWFCSLKPHLFLPLAAVLLVWMVVSRSYRILLGAVTAVAASCIVTWFIDPSAWPQYLHWAANSGIVHEPIPCLSVVLHNLLDPAAEWLVFLPAIVASVWALIYFWRHRHVWDWLEHGNLLMLVSLLVAPYCWIHDQVLALPALVYAAWRTPSRALLVVLAAVYVLLEIQSFDPTGLISPLYLWPAPVWLAWYLAARAKTPAAEVSPSLGAPAEPFS